LIAGCGGRTQLEVASYLADGGQDALADGASPRDASAEPGADAPAEAPADSPAEAPPDSAPPPADCPSQVLAGAPKPMAGYCSTRANRASIPAPAKPAVVWSTQLATTKEPIAAVVDPKGRLYVTYDPTTDSSLVPRAIAAVEPNGAIAWTQTFDETLRGSPVLASDGRVLMVRGPFTAPALLAFRPDGTFETIMKLPELTAGGPAVGSDRSLYFAIDGISNPARVMKVVGAQVAWTSVELGKWPQHVALDRRDRAIVGTTTASTARVHVLGSGGTVAWQRDFDGYLVDGPAVARDDAIVVSLGREQLSKAVLVVIEPSGTVRRTVDLGDKPQTAYSALAVGADGTVVVRTWERTFAVGPDGVVRWQRATHPNVMYDLTIGSDATLVLMSGAAIGVDLATGAERWVLGAPQVWECVTSAGLGAGGRFYGKQCGGTVFAAAD
jgi:hypothetical protein